MCLVGKMKMFLWLICLKFVFCALPLQFESEFYCPRNFCLQESRKHINTPGFSGSGTQVYECCDLLDASNTTFVHPWGEEARPDAAEYRQQLIDHQYHTTGCPADSTCAKELDGLRSVALSPPFPLCAMATLRRIESFFSL